MQNQTGGKRGRFNVWGLALVVVGSLLVLREAGVLPDISLWTVFWLGLGSWLTLETLRGSRSGGWFWPLGLVAAGLILLARDLDWLPADFSLWPVLVIVIGLSILVGGATHRRDSG